MSRGTQQHTRSPLPFAYRTFTFYGRPFQAHSARERVSYSFPRTEVGVGACYNTLTA